MLRWFEHSQVYHPSRAMDASGTELGRPFEDVRFQSSDGLELNGWYFPGDTNSARSGFVVLFCHGNAGNISHRLGSARAILQTGVGVFLFDYRGYGRSQGRPSEEGTYRDAEAAWRWLCSRGFVPANIVVLGESLGGGVASELATRQAIGGLVLLSSFTSVPDVGAELFPWLPVRWISTIKYDTRSKLSRLTVPIMVMHSREDDIIGFTHSEKNFAAIAGPKLMWELSGGHNSGFEEEDHFVTGLEKFLRMVEAEQARK